MKNEWAEVRAKYLSAGFSGSENDYESLLTELEEKRLHKDFFAMLYYARKALSKERILSKWLHYVSVNESYPIPRMYIGDENCKYKNSKLAYYVGLLIDSDELLELYLLEPYMVEIQDDIYYSWIENDNWDQFIKYMVFVIKHVSPDEFLESKIKRYLDECVSAIVPRRNDEVFYLYDRFDREKAHFIREREAAFINALISISIVLNGDSNHEPYHFWLKTSLKNIYGNLEALKETCFEEAENSCVADLITCVHKIMDTPNIGIIEEDESPELYYCLETFYNNYKSAIDEQTDDLMELYEELFFERAGDVSDEECKDFYVAIDYTLDYFTSLSRDDIVVDFFVEHFDSRNYQESILSCLVLTCIFNEEYTRASDIFNKIIKIGLDDNYDQGLSHKGESIVCHILSDYRFKRGLFWGYNYGIMDDFILGEIDKIKDFFMGNGRCSAKAVYEELKQEIEE